MKPNKSGRDRIEEKYPIVGIGASAGGLEALQIFFDNLPNNLGTAFVIVQHLSPDYKSFMSELLARHTSIPIEMATDNVDVKRNHIYLIPPKMNMTIIGGRLYLTAIEGRALNLPIDIFFRSLAADQESNAIGIILSGTGTDGTLGIRAIKDTGGIIMVQDAKTAKFDGMPKSSISTGMVDFIASPSQLAVELANYIKHPLVKKSSSVELQLLKSQSVFSNIIRILHDFKNIDFSKYKQDNLVKRLEKRISINQFERVSDYVNFLSNSPKEVSALFNAFLIGATVFFRDEKAFNTLYQLVIPQIFEKYPDNSEIRIWIPACGTGEEAYSIAILFKEYMSVNNLTRDVKIFATDIDEKSLNFAGIGFYPNNISADVPNQYLSKYFIHIETGFQVNDNIRQMIIFAKHNLIDEPPFFRLNLISCRNLLTYMNVETQLNILSTFHTCLKSDAYLFIGSDESINKLEECFDVVDSNTKIYKKNNLFNAKFSSTPTFNSQLHCTRSETAMQLPPKVDTKQMSGLFEDIVNAFLPHSVIIDRNYNVLYSFHDVGKYLQLPMGKVSTNFLKMLTKENSVLIGNLLKRAEKHQEDSNNIDIVIDNILVNITCSRVVNEDDDSYCFLLSFNEKKHDDSLDVADSKAFSIDKQYQFRIDDLEQELQSKNESLQATVEELETSNEELQSSNEELIASNEELQSTNEELQSVNEELYTVNSENTNKIEELTELNNDFNNLLINTQIGTIFLDNNLIIRKITDLASKITNIFPADIGRPLADLSLKSLYYEFYKDVENVATTSLLLEKEIQHDNKWYLMKIVPSQTTGNANYGIVITFINISSFKKSRDELNVLTDKLEQSLEMTKMIWWEWIIEKDLFSYSPNLCNILGYNKQTIGSDKKSWTTLIHCDDVENHEALLLSCISGRIKSYSMTYRIKNSKGEYMKFKVKGGVSHEDSNNIPEIISGILMSVSDNNN